MKLTRVMITAALAFLLGGSAVVFATPAAAARTAARTSKQQCPNINCAWSADLGIYCHFSVGELCSMANPNRCQGDTC